MGRLLFFVIAIAAVLAGVWFFVPNGQSMLLGAKDTVIGMMPGKAAEEAAPVEETVVEEVIDPTVEAVEEAVEETAEEAAPAEETAPE
jgi:hypothetical protein